jgi:3D (Asp-Asp-Asp) domain-containing protein
MGKEHYCDYYASNLDRTTNRHAKRYQQLLATVSAYCLNGPTAVGSIAHEGIIAVDPDVIPLRSWVKLGGRVFRAEDTGAYIRGHHVDVWIPDCTRAVRYGMRHLRLRVISKR